MFEYTCLAIFCAFGVQPMMLMCLLEVSIREEKKQGEKPKWLEASFIFYLSSLA